MWEIGVFASIDAGLGVSLDVVGELGIPTIQLHAPHAHSRNPEKARRFLDRLAEIPVRLTAVFGGFEGESYASIPVVEQTVGLVPAATRAARLAEMKEIADFAQILKCPVVALHLGFVPHNIASRAYREVIDVTRDLCDHCAGLGQSLHLETGQETASALCDFMDEVDRNNLFVNFDPANMILYGTGEPREAVRLLGNRIRSVHCKDAKWSDQPGKTWGTEVPLGEGDVQIDAWLRELLAIGYRGPLTIEREIPQEPQRQKAGIGHAVALLERLRREILPPT